MYLYLLIAVIVLQFLRSDSCMATPATNAAPEIPLLPCQTCAAPALTDVPGPAKPTYKMGGGSVAPGDPVTAAMCKTFIITCNAGTGDLQIGIDQIIGTALAGPAAPGVKLTATVVCNGDGKLEAQAVVPAGTRVTLTTAYCAVVA